MEENTQETYGPLETLANIADQFTLFTPNSDPDSKRFSIDIDNVTFIFIRD